MVGEWVGSEARAEFADCFVAGFFRIVRVAD